MTPELFHMGCALILIPVPVIILYNIIVWFKIKRAGKMYKNALIALRDNSDKIDAGRAGFPVGDMHKLLQDRAYLHDLLESYEGR